MRRTCRAPRPSVAETAATLRLSRRRRGSAGADQRAIPLRGEAASQTVTSRDSFEREHDQRNDPARTGRQSPARGPGCGTRATLPSSVRSRPPRHPEPAGEHDSGMTRKSSSAMADRPASPRQSRLLKNSVHSTPCRSSSMPRSPSSAGMTNSPPRNEDSRQPAMMPGQRQRQPYFEK